MRGDDRHQEAMFSYLFLEERVPAGHPLRVFRQLVEPVLADLSPDFEQLYAKVGRPSIRPSSCCGRCSCTSCTRCAASAC